MGQVRKSVLISLIFILYTLVVNAQCELDTIYIEYRESEVTSKKAFFYKESDRFHYTGKNHPLSFSFWQKQGSRKDTVSIDSIRKIDIKPMGVILWKLDGKQWDVDYYEALCYKGLETTEFYQDEIKGTDEENFIVLLRNTLLSGRAKCKE